MGDCFGGRLAHLVPFADAREALLALETLPPEDALASLVKSVEQDYEANAEGCKQQPDDDDETTSGGVLRLAYFLERAAAIGARVRRAEMFLRLDGLRLGLSNRRDDQGRKVRGKRDGLGARGAVDGCACRARLKLEVLRTIRANGFHAQGLLFGLCGWRGRFILGAKVTKKPPAAPAACMGQTEMR